MHRAHSLWPTLAASATLALSAQSALAHHSSALVYDRGRIIEAEGTVAEVVWTNPHVRLKITGAGPDGRERVWNIESNSVSTVSRFGLTADLVAVGSHVKIAGNPGRARGDAMWLTNMLLPNGAEILFGAGITARFSNRTIGRDVRSAVAADTGDRGIFRVWSNATAPPDFWGDHLPLTPAAAAARAAHDPAKDDPTLNCTPKGMPYIMEEPYPIEFVDEGERILLKLEEYDTVRRISMTGKADGPGNAGPARLGTSIGRWEGATLVVDTRDIDYKFVNGNGIPLGPAASIEERFSMNEDGSRLEYTMTIDDASTFIEPVTLRKSWEWRPGEQVRPYNCRR